MKIPASPPPWPTLLEKYSGDLGRLISYRLGPEVRGVYEHWDHLRHLTPPVEGMDVDEVISRLEGIKCGPKSTSCPDQLATALKEHFSK